MTYGGSMTTEVWPYYFRTFLQRGPNFPIARYVYFPLPIEEMNLIEKLASKTFFLFFVLVENSLPIFYFFSMASLLAKFRIDYSDVIVIPDVTKKAGDAIKEEFKTITDKVNIDEAELLANKEKSNRNMRLAEILREHSTSSEMVIM